MQEIKFGRKQLNNPTPAAMERKLKIFVGIAGIIIAWMPTNNVVPHNIQDIVTPILGLMITLGSFLLPFVGVETDSKKIPIEDVQAIEKSN